MKEELISFNTAIIAKKFGFFDLNINNKVRLSQDKIYFEDGTLHDLSVIFSEGFYKSGDDLFNAPTQALLQKWLRDTHVIVVIINAIDYRTYNYQISMWLNNDTRLTNIYGNLRHTYEQALEKGLLKALKLIKK